MQLTAGYTAYNGHVFTSTEAAQYNAIQALIEAFEADGMDAPVELINARYATFSRIIHP